MMAEQDAINQLDADTRFAVRKIYVKDLSFETPNVPEVFDIKWKPEVDMHLTNEARLLSENIYEVVLSVTLSVGVGDKIAYLAEVNQAGIFFIDNAPQVLMERILATVCPNILFPFVREVCSDLVTRGGFPQLLLAPVNFEVLYARQQQTAPQPDLTH